MNIVLALLATAGIELVLRFGLDRSLPGIAFIGLYLVLFYAIERLREKKTQQHVILSWLPEWGQYPVEDLSGMTASGPIGRVGAWALMLVFFASQLLMVLNPWQLREVILQMVGNAALAWRERRTHDSGQRYRTKVDYCLPVQGEWLVLNGGMTPKGSHSWGILGQRFALDLVRTDGRLQRHLGSGTKLSEYLCYEAPIVAAQDGVVVGLEGRIKDAPWVGWGVCDVSARSFIGNYLIIEHAPGEFALYAHLKPGSLTVAVGDRVHQGQVVGLCGNSGHSTEPHLHFHLQDSADPYHGMGLPISFSDLEIGGHQAMDARLRSGHRVRSTL